MVRKEQMSRILIVDDDQAFLDTYRELLADDGYVPETATDAGTARTRLEEGTWDVVLLDQKLQGPGGPNGGLDLVADAQRLSPGAKVIVITAYATDVAIERAFEQGAYDYIEKTPRLAALLRVKLRNALSAVRSRRLASRAPELEDQIRSLWTEVRTEADRNRKGALLEDLLVSMLATVVGFEQIEPRRRNPSEEIDILVRVASRDPFWQKESLYLLVECKNWTRKVGVAEFTSFHEKLRKRYGRCEIGLFIAPGGFARTFADELRAARSERLLIIPVGPEDLARLVAAADRNETLEELHQRAVVKADGSAR